ncbi:MAG: hypothetical protein ACK5P5_10425 [Pseudobdellovibrionaceae bacterium]
MNLIIAVLFFTSPWIHLLVFKTYLTLFTDQSVTLVEFALQLQFQQWIAMILLSTSSIFYLKNQNNFKNLGLLIAGFFICFHVFEIVFANPFETNFVQTEFHFTSIVVTLLLIFMVFLPFGLVRKWFVRGEKSKQQFLIQKKIEILDYTNWFGETKEITPSGAEIQMQAPFSPKLLRSSDLKMIFCDHPNIVFKAIVVSSEGLALRVIFLKLNSKQKNLLASLRSHRD